MAILNRDAILGARDLPTKEVPVPEWGGSVYVRPLSVAEAEHLMTLGEGKSYQVTLAAQTICDADGNRVFTNEDVEALMKKSAMAITRIVVAVQAISALSVKEAEDVQGN